MFFNKLLRNMKRICGVASLCQYGWIFLYFSKFLDKYWNKTLVYCFLAMFFVAIYEKNGKFRWRLVKKQFLCVNITSFVIVDIIGKLSSLYSEKYKCVSNYFTKPNSFFVNLSPVFHYYYFFCAIFYSFVLSLSKYSEKFSSIQKRHVT